LTKPPTETTTAGLNGLLFQLKQHQTSEESATW